MNEKYVKQVETVSHISARYGVIGSSIFQTSKSVEFTSPICKSYEHTRWFGLSVEKTTLVNIAVLANLLNDFGIENKENPRENSRSDLFSVNT